MMEWQSINTAPRDGTEILVYCEGLNDFQRVLSGDIVIAAWNTTQFRGGAWYSDSESSMEGYESTGDYVVHDPICPTHWMPLPDPPRKNPGKETPPEGGTKR